MLKFLPEPVLNEYNEIIAVRNDPRSKEEKELIYSLLTHNWYWPDSAVRATRQAGEEAQAKLIKRIHDSCLNADAKDYCLGLFEAGYDRVNDFIRANQSMYKVPYLDKNPTEGWLGLAFSGMTEDQFQIYLDLYEVLFDIQSKLYLSKSAGRVVTTDAYIANKDVFRKGVGVYVLENGEEILPEVIENLKGVTIPASIQEKVNNFTRLWTPLFVEMVKSGVLDVLSESHAINTKIVPGYWLFSYTIGFNFSSTVSMLIDPKAEACPACCAIYNGQTIGPNDAKGGRKKIEAINHNHHNGSDPMIVWVERK